MQVGHNGHGSVSIASFRDAVAFLEKAINYERTRDWK